MDSDEWEVYEATYIKVAEDRWIMEEDYAGSPTNSPYVPSAYDSQAVQESLHRSLGGKMIRERTKLERLKDAKAGLEAKLKEINTAIQLLEENPKIMEIIHAMERAGV